MSKVESRKIGKKIIKALSNRKGFDWWFAEIDASTRKEIEEEIGEAAIKAVYIP